METNTWFVIVNPVSGGKKGPRTWHTAQRFLKAAGIPCREAFTHYRGHALELAEAAAGEGYRHFLIIGGDGTANEVLNGLLRSAVPLQACTLAMISAGTGNDWVRSTGRLTDIRRIGTLLLRNETFVQDIGILDYLKEGKPARDYFVNIAGIGFDGYVARKIYFGSRMLAGTKLQYWIAILKSLLFCRHAEMQVSVEGKTRQLKTLSIAAGIGKYNGGGLMQLPNAVYDDGLLDMTVITSMSKFKMLRSLPKLSNGSFLRMREVLALRSASFGITADPPAYVEADGEYLGTTPATIGIMPRALRLIRWD